MCEKLPYCAKKIDPCLVSQIKMINANCGLTMKTISSCCGHGKYKPTIVLLRMDGKMIEWFSHVIIGNYDYKKKKQYNRIYKKDKDGVYFIPEIFLHTENNPIDTFSQ